MTVDIYLEAAPEPHRTILRKLRATLRSLLPEAPETLSHVGIRRGDAEIHLSEHPGDAPAGSLVYLWVEGVADFAAEFGQVVEDMEWGREIEVYDPDGNRIRVAERHTPT